jgi:hypothetical protein
MTNENIEHKVDVTFTTGESTNEYLKNKIIPIIMNEEAFDIKDNNRTYYYNIRGTMVPDYESMAAYLLDEGILFAGQAGAKYDNGKECVGLFININDYFVPASDAEAVTYDVLPKLYEMYKERKYDGVSQFVADKRGIPNIYWKDEGSSFRTRMKEKD